MPSPPRAALPPFTRRAAGLATACLTALAAASRAEEGTPPAAPASAEPGSRARTEPLLETTREAVRDGATWLARSVDGWFGNLRFEDGGSVSDGRVTLVLLQRESESLDQRLRFDARFRLPNIERHAYLFAGRGNEREAVTDQPDTLGQQQRLLSDNDSQQKFVAGLGMTFLDAFDLRLGLRGALKPYAQARYRREWGLAEGGIAAFSQTFFWTVQDQIGSTTALSLEAPLGSTLTFRWMNSATITRRSEDYEWFTLLGAYRPLAGQRLLAVEALANGVHHAPVDVADVGLRVRWSQPVWRDWVIGEVLVGHFWPHPDPAIPRDRRWGFGLSLTMKF